MKSVFNKKVVSLVVVVMLLSFSAALAAEIVPMARLYFLMGACKMGKPDNDTLYLNAYTLAKQQVSRVNVTIFLQAYINGTWVNVWSASQTAYGASKAEIDRFVKPSKGYIYRLFAEHNVSSRGIKNDYYPQLLIVN